MKGLSWSLRFLSAIGKKWNCCSLCTTGCQYSCLRWCSTLQVSGEEMWVFFEEPQLSEHCWSDLQVRHLAASILLRQSQSSSLATESLIINPPNSLRPPPIKPLLQCQLSTLHQRSVEGEWKKGWCRKVIKNFFQTPSASPCPQISVPAVYLKYRLPQTMSAIKAHQQTAILQLWSFWALGQRHLLPHPTEHREFILTATQNSVWQREQLLVQPKWLGYKQFRLI